MQCWFCEQTVAYEGFDPCAVLLIANWADESRQQSQQFFAHVECFRQSGSGDLYLLDPEDEEDVG